MDLHDTYRSAWAGLPHQPVAALADDTHWDTFDALGYRLIQHRDVDDVLVLEREHLVLAPAALSRPELARLLARWISDR